MSVLNRIPEKQFPSRGLLSFCMQGHRELSYREADIAPPGEMIPGMTAPEGLTVKCSLSGFPFVRDPAEDRSQVRIAFKRFRSQFVQASLSRLQTVEEYPLALEQTPEAIGTHLLKQPDKGDLTVSDIKLLLRGHRYISPQGINIDLFQFTAHSSRKMCPGIPEE